MVRGVTFLTRACGVRPITMLWVSWPIRADCACRKEGLCRKRPWEALLLKYLHAEHTDLFIIQVWISPYAFVEFNFIFVYCHTTYLSISKGHFIFFNPVQSSFTPESCRLLLLMFSSFRLVSDSRTVARAEQHLSVKPQSFSLQEK